MVKLARQSGTPESVARGVFIGFFIGLLIPFGFQIMIAVPLAFVFRANKITSVTFTFITNPWSIVAIYPFQCYLGSHLIGRTLSYGRLKEIFSGFLKKVAAEHLSISDTYAELMNLGREIVIPFFIGGALLGLIAGVIGYIASLYLVKALRERKEKRKLERRQKHINDRANKEA